jgi:hypothetical protein
MNKYLSGTWEEFEAWIRSTIGSHFRWKLRPQDQPAYREMIAGLIVDAINSNNGVFPQSNAFIERTEQ